MALIDIPDPTKATINYVPEEQLGAWLHANITIDPSSQLVFADLYTRYSDWCVQTRTTRLSRRALGSRIEARRYRSNGVMYLLGARLI